MTAILTRAARALCKAQSGTDVYDDLEPEAQEAAREHVRSVLESLWQPIDTAPKDGTWILLRGRNAANRPMIPVVCAWRQDSRGAYAWRDAAGLADMSHLVTDVPADGEADWLPLPQ